MAATPAAPTLNQAPATITPAAPEVAPTAPSAPVNPDPMAPAATAVP